MGTSQWPRSRVPGVRVVMMGLKYFSSGSIVAMLLSDFVRWVSKALCVDLGRDGCISSVRGLSFGGGEEAGGFSALGDEGKVASTVGRISSAEFSDGGEEGTSRRGRFALGGKKKGAGAGGRASTVRSSDGGEESTCNHGRFVIGGEARRVGEGELEAKGPLR